MTTSTSGEKQPHMNIQLLKAATDGKLISLKELSAENLSMLLGTTPEGNTCLHISSFHGHEEFCMDVLALNHCLLSKVNLEEETPLWCLQCLILVKVISWAPRLML
jgi:hypothetical protein